MSAGRLERLAAFTTNPAHGNPAGVWRGAELPGADHMQRVAREVGYSETIFLAQAGGKRYHVRYFSPAAEVPFCGHATIAAGVRLGRDEGAGSYHFDTQAGDVAVRVREQDGTIEASLTSVEPRHEIAGNALVAAALACLGWSEADLDTAIPPARAYAGAWHLVLAAATRDRLAHLEYEFETLKALMLQEGLTTLQLVWRKSAAILHSRNPFPVGGVVEDPATGAAAAALGGYLRDAGLIEAPAALTIRQGEDMGRPGLLKVDIPQSGGIVVRGTAVAIVE
jgi:PhzF family phenazine biosynthesis protein